MPEHVAVINAGGWGTALAVLLSNAGHAVRLWCRRADLAFELDTARENRTYLPGVSIPRSVVLSASLEEILAGAHAVILAPISRAMRETGRAIAPLVPPGTPVMHVSKGLEL